MKTPLFPLLAIGLLLPSGAGARLGETLEECRARYGAPVEIDSETRTAAFHKEGFLVAGEFDAEGRCEFLIFTKVSREALSETEMEILVRANLGDDYEADSIGLTKVWINPGGTIAGYDIVDNALIFRTAARWNRETAERAAGEKERLKGF